MKFALRKLRHSLFVQLGVLASLFIGLVVLLINVSTSQVADETGNPSDQVYEHVGALLMYTASVPDASMEDFLQSDIMVQVTEKNPEFRYLVISRKGTFSSTLEDAAPYYPNLVYDNTESGGHTETKLGEQCRISSRGMEPFVENGYQGVALYDQCPHSYSYVEIAGIDTTATLSDLGADTSLYSFLGLSAYRRFLILGFGVLLIAMTIIYRIIKSVARISRATRRIDLDNLGVRINEDKLPLELLPIAQSLNSMVHRIEESGERQKLFLAAAAHELRTPITILRMRLEEIENSATKDSIRTQLRQMSRLIEQLLDLSRLRSIDELPLERVNLVTAVREVCRGRAPIGLEKGVELELNAEKPSIYVSGDVSMISTAVATVIDNAISFSKPQDTVHIRIRSDGCVQIQDQGTGIPDGVEFDIFEPFAKKTPNRRGHGLGLAIVKAIMSLHEGSVSAQNMSGEGALFSLKFNAEHVRR